MNYNKFASIIAEYLEKDKIEEAIVNGHEQYDEEGIEPFPSSNDNKRIFVRWFGDNPKNHKEIVMIGYIELISDTEMRCMLLESLV